MLQLVFSTRSIRSCFEQAGFREIGAIAPGHLDAVLANTRQEPFLKEKEAFENGRLFIAADGEAVHGHCFLAEPGHGAFAQYPEAPDGAACGYIGSLFTGAACRKQNFADYMLDAAADYGRAMGWDFLMARSHFRNDGAFKCFTRNGYLPTARTQEGDGSGYYYLLELERPRPAAVSLCMTAR